MDMRIIEEWVDGQWRKVKMSDLKQGSIFRMFEEEGIQVKDNKGCMIWEALGDPHIVNKQGVFGVEVRSVSIKE